MNMSGLALLLADYCEFSKPSVKKTQKLFISVEVQPRCVIMRKETCILSPIDYVLSIAKFIRKEDDGRRLRGKVHYVHRCYQTNTWG